MHTRIRRLAEEDLRSEKRTIRGNRWRLRAQPWQPATHSILRGFVRSPRARMYSKRRPPRPPRGSVVLLRQPPTPDNAAQQAAERAVELVQQRLRRMIRARVTMRFRLRSAIAIEPHRMMAAP